MRRPEVFIVEDQVRTILDRGPGHREYVVALELDQGEVFHIHVQQPTSPLTGFPCVAVVQVIERPVPGGEALARAQGAFDERFNQHPWWGANHVVVTLVASDEHAISARSYVFDRTGSPTEASTVFVLSRATHVRRSTGVPTCDTLSQCRVAVVGLGTCGSLVASALAKAGVGRFALIDHRRLDRTTVAQHLCGISDLGRFATRAVRDRLFDTNPFLTCDTVEVDVGADFDALRSHVHGCDLLVSTSDSGHLHRRLNALAITARTPVVLGLSRPHVGGDAVLRVRPFKGPCLGCLGCECEQRGVEPRVVQGRSDGPRTDRNASDVNGGTLDEGSFVDASAMTAMVVRLALGELCRDSAGATTPPRADREDDHYLWIDGASGGFAGHPGLGRRTRGQAIVGWLSTGAKRNPACPVCASSKGRQTNEH